MIYHFKKLSRSIISDSVIISSNNQDIMFNLFNGVIHERVALNDEYRQINFETYQLKTPIDQTNHNNARYIRGDRELTLSMLNYTNDSLSKKIKAF